MNKWSAKDVYRTTKCFGSWGPKKEDGTRVNGAFPNGFMKWVEEMGWHGRQKAYLCAGGVNDPFSTTVDIRPEVKPTHIEDARNTTLPDNHFDWVMIDPPYSRQLAKDLYGTDEFYSSVNEFTKEGSRILKPGGLILTLTYEIPKRIKACNFIAVCGIYTIPMTGYMRCFTVSKKEE